MATEKALSERLVSEGPEGPEGSEAPEVARQAAVRELIRLLVKAQKAQRLYDRKNAISEKLETDLFNRLSHFLESDGAINLVVLEFHLKFEDDVVYDSHDRNDSLAFLLYRDGVRRLSFHPGLEPEELQAFLTCLNRVAVLAIETAQEDLVTLFWERDFHGIRYFAIEELSTGDTYPRLEEQLATEDLSCEGAEGRAEGVSLDLEQPVSTVPVEACRLDDAELKALRAELASEVAMPFQHVVTELAIELTFLEENEDERAELIKNLVAISDRLIADGDLEELAAMEEHLDGLATMVFRDDERVRNLAATFLKHLSEPARVEAFLGKVDEHHAPKPEVLTAYLARMGNECTPTLLKWMGRLSSSAYRRAVTNALLVSQDGGVAALNDNLPLGAPGASRHEQLEHRQFVRELLYAISQHPGERALPVLERILHAHDPETRRESFVAISRYPEDSVDALLLDRLSDRDPEIRATALDTVVRRGKKELGQQALNRLLGTSGSAEQSLNEKRLFFAGVAKLCGESVLDQWRVELTGKEDRWFTSKKDKELAEAVSHGIRMIGTDAALTFLERLAGGGARFVKAACAKELGR